MRELRWDITQFHSLCHETFLAKQPVYIMKYLTAASSCYETHQQSEHTNPNRLNSRYTYLLQGVKV